MERKPHTQNLVGVLTIITLLISCNAKTPPVSNSDCELPEMQEIDSDLNENESRICLIPESDPNANLEINANLRDFTVNQEEKMRESLRRLKIIVNSVAFKEKILNHQYNGVKTFYDNGGLSNQQVYDVIMAGSEKLDPGADGEMDIDITLYYANNSTVGYTYPDVLKIWVNNKFFAGNSYGKVAANVIHEWTHKLGFEHDFNRTTQRNYSVPYGVGTIIRELVDSM